MPVIAIDFDGTIVEEGYWPEIGPEIYGAIEGINTLYDWGYCIIINSCRCDEAEQKMKEWLDRHGVKYCRINENCPERIKKYGSDCRKIAADAYIDDKTHLYHGYVPDWLQIPLTIEQKFGNCVISPCKGGEHV